jgi:hypothetical protein
MVTQDLNTVQSLTHIHKLRRKSFDICVAQVYNQSMGMKFSQGHAPEPLFKLMTSAIILSQKSSAFLRQKERFLC